MEWISLRSGPIPLSQAQPRNIVTGAVMPEIRLSDLPQYRSVIDGAHFGWQVEQIFAASDAPPAVIVTRQGGQYAGLLSRHRFNELMARPYGLDLHRRRPIEQLLNQDSQADLLLQGDLVIEAAARAAWSRPEGQIYEPLSARLADGDLVVITMFDLLQALSQRLEQQNQQSATLLRELADSNRELNLTLTQLRQAQAELVQAEKMASLGSLVAGVAHEISTPLGVMLAASTNLVSRAASLQEGYAKKTLTASILTEELGRLSDGTALIARNASRAAELLDGFKKVAVDQTSSQRRSFPLKAYLNDILLSIAPRFKKYPVAIKISCPDEIECDSLPGPLAQVMINLLVNAFTHAFDPGQSSTISITAKQKAGTVKITVADDGRGIPDEVLPHIFDPFFTTRRGEGGSGLGLHIVYNLMVSVLMGSVSVRSALGRGTRFTLRFPRIHPKPWQEEPAP